MNPMEAANSTSPILELLRRVKAKSQYDQALAQHRRRFNPENFGLNRKDYVDSDLAMEEHMANFDPSTVSRHHYDDDEEGENEYNQALLQAREDHAARFDPEEWTNDDSLLRDEYRRRLIQAQIDHDSQFVYDPDRVHAETTNAAGTII